MFPAFFFLLLFFYETVSVGDLFGSFFLPFWIYTIRCLSTRFQVGSLGFVFYDFNVYMRL
jgi:hypothetical protein